MMTPCYPLTMPRLCINVTNRNSGDEGAAKSRSRWDDVRFLPYTDEPQISNNFGTLCPDCSMPSPSTVCSGCCWV
ncbi:hypothetical protein D3C79_652920 [compost metagenome]